MMLSWYITPVLMSIICANIFVGCLPAEYGANGIRKRESLYHKEIPRCMINEGGLPVKISPACQHVLHKALFPDEPRFSSKSSENILAQPPHPTQPSSSIMGSKLAEGPVLTDEAPLKENGVRVITPEEGLHWLWGILDEDCNALEDLLSTMAVLIADKQEEEEPKSWKESHDILTDSDIIELRDARFHSKRKRDAQTTVGLPHFPRAREEPINRYLTPTELALLNGNFPTNPPPGRSN